ncbi:molybdate ABC transporter permease subunit [Heliorestis convoluta]|uniref:Molybdenum transport system permease n=1 Tax=Heliorestis convoluta TaxID=356322 RepID=A0A5Q2MWI9_9FIRM|nr:molybdate ABC transporter permease subunit [Heliorestis convoluta]QGG46778.1 molybdate ABC transporter inner membrane subunit [Heliorestis convoluta]
MEHIDLFPLILSFQVAFIATVIGFVVGLPIAWWLGQSKRRWVEVFDSLLTLPMILPPTVLGYYLLVLVGRNSVIGQFFESLGLPLVFTIRGVIIAATLVSIPFFIKTSRAAIEGVSKDLLDAARVLGRNEFEIFFYVIIPNAWRGIVAGLVLMFARALGDFGTTLMVAGSIPGVTMTMPIAIYNSMLAGEQEKANLLVLIMTATAFMVLIVINLLHRKDWRDSS